MKTCRMLNLFLATLIVGLMSSGTANALYLYNFKISGPELDGEGYFEAATLSTTPGGIDDFRFSGHTYGNTWSCFGAACLAKASWKIDDILGITDLNLQVGYRNTRTSGVLASLELTERSAGSWCWDQISTRCDRNNHDHTNASVSFTSSQQFNAAAFGAPASFTSVQQIPEPSLVFLLSIAVATLAIASWRRG